MCGPGKFHYLTIVIKAPSLILGVAHPVGVREDEEEDLDLIEDRDERETKEKEREQRFKDHDKAGDKVMFICGFEDNVIDLQA